MHDFHNKADTLKEIYTVALDHVRTRPGTAPRCRGRKSVGLLAGATATALACLLTIAPVTAAECQFAPPTEPTILAQVEPQLLIDGTCTDPFYNENTFVETSRQQREFQVPGGPLISYTEVSGFFPARTDPLPDRVSISSTLNQQDYVFRFPAPEYWRNRSMQVQHPTTPSSIVDNRLAFTNGALSVNHINASRDNTVGHVRHHAAATKLAKHMANQMYGPAGKIYSYYWGCSGGGQMAQGAAEGVTGVWDGISIQCPATLGNPTHAFQWRSHYQFALPLEKRQHINMVSQLGNGVNATDGLTREESTLLYAGLNDEEKFVLTEFLSAGFPLNEMPVNTAFGSLEPITGTNEIVRVDPAYEDDFWDSGILGYAGTNPPAYLAAAKMDGFATITAINRDAADTITSIQLDPVEIPPVPASPIGTTGQRFYVFAADGVTRTTDPTAPSATAGATLSGSLNRTTGLLTLSGTNSPVLLDAVTVGGKIRVNNRFILSALFYPRHTIVPGYFNYDQYRNADGTPKYPQRPISLADVLTVRQTGGVLESGNIKTKVMLFQNLSDSLAFPSWVAGYANVVETALGPAKANDMLRLYYQERGGHSSGGIVSGIFTQSLLDLMAWAEEGIKPKPSSRFTFELPLTQVILPEKAAQRKGLQPVIELTANGDPDSTVVGVNEPVKLDGEIQMPPSTGEVTKFSWTGLGDAGPTSVIAKPNQKIKINRTTTFATAGDYIIRLEVEGQQEGIAEPESQTVKRNFKEVRVVVQ